jgi:hypothetical protein
MVVLSIVVRVERAAESFHRSDGRIWGNTRLFSVALGKLAALSAPGTMLLGASYVFMGIPT